MTVSKIDPILDSRWDAFVQSHPDACSFHTPGWLQALHRTYGFQPVAYTTRFGQELEGGIVVCDVDSWLTGKRSICLPFSDHCSPLVNSASAFEELAAFICTD